MQVAETLRAAELLGQIPLFEALKAEDLAALAQRVLSRKYRSGERVFDKGDSAESMYVVLSGAVQIFLPGTEAEQSIVLKDAHVGEYFGELSLFDEKPRSASAEATTEAHLLELRREELGTLVGRSKTAALVILTEMAGRLRETNAMLSQRAARDVVREIDDALTWDQKLADRVAELNGSWKFIGALVVLTAGWVVANACTDPPFDAYPYQFYNLAIAVLIAVQGPLIMMSQKRQSTKERARAQTDFRVNLKNENGLDVLQQEIGLFRDETNERFGIIERTLRGTQSWRDAR